MLIRIDKRTGKREKVARVPPAIRYIAKHHHISEKKVEELLAKGQRLEIKSCEYEQVPKQAGDDHYYCRNCARKIPLDQVDGSEWVETIDGYYCPICCDTHLSFCSRCQNWFAKSGAKEVKGKGGLYCSDCRIAMFICDWCGSPVIGLEQDNRRPLGIESDDLADDLICPTCWGMWVVVTRKLKRGIQAAN